MSLSDLIKKDGLLAVATATPATPEWAKGLTVAGVAGVAVATPPPLTGELQRVAEIAKCAFGDVTTESVDQAEDLREYFDERAAIMEHDGGLPRHQAEMESARITCQYAMNAKYDWRSLCEALAAYPPTFSLRRENSTLAATEIVSMIPNTSGPVDHLPLGLARHAVIPESSFIKGKDRVVRQGAYSTGTPSR